MLSEADPELAEATTAAEAPAVETLVVEEPGVETPTTPQSPTAEAEGQSATEAAAGPKSKAVKANRECELCTFYGPCRRSHLTEVDGCTIYRNCCEACNEINRAMVLSRSTCGIKDREEYVEKLRDINDRYNARVRRYNETGEGKVYWEYVKNPDPFVRRPLRPTTAKPGQKPKKRIEILSGEYDDRDSAKQTLGNGAPEDGASSAQQSMQSTENATREVLNTPQGAETVNSAEGYVMGARSCAPAVAEALRFCTCGNEFMDDALFCRICGAKRHEIASQAPSDGVARSPRSQEKCVCGNTLLPDSVFCRKCGVRRPDVLGAANDERCDLLAGNLDRPSAVPVST